jgi:hypothetical protein
VTFLSPLSRTTSLLAYLLACLVAYLLACLVAYCLLAYMLACLLAYMLACLLICLLAWCGLQVGSRCGGNGSQGFAGASSSLSLLADYMYMVDWQCHIKTGGSSH